MTPREYRRAEKLQISGIFPAHSKQRERILERRRATPTIICVDDVEFTVLPGVYQTSVDTRLMAHVVKPRTRDTVLEVGCGCGAVTLLMARQCRKAMGVDINPIAIANSRENADRLGIRNATFQLSDVFSDVNGAFDVIICNPPYNEHPAEDSVEKMFWDPGDLMKRQFFRDVRRFLKHGGRVFFGWADFVELDETLPMRLAAQAGLRYVRHFSAPSANGAQCFHVIKMRPEQAGT